MNRRQTSAMLLRAVHVLCALIPICASAKPLPTPFTPLEQMATLSSAASQMTALKLYRAGRDATIARQLYQHDYRARYRRASLGERNTIAMTIGEEGVERFAGERRLKVLLSPRGRSIPMGPDSVYWNPKSGTLQVLEAKGGTSQIKRTFDSLQGTNKNAIRSVGGYRNKPGFLHRSGTTWKEKVQMARVIKAAQKGHLETAVVKTSHVLGRPGDPRQSGSWNTDRVAKEARRIERELIRQKPHLRKVFRIALFLHNVDRSRYHGARKLSDFASATARSIGLSATQQARLVRFGKVGVRWLLPLSVGVAGVTMVTAYHQYATGLMSSREFYRSSTGPTIFVVFTSTGAIAGAFLLGVGAVPGAALGAMAALPVEVAADWMIGHYYREFDLRQRRIVDAAIEEFYGVDADLVEAS